MKLPVTLAAGLLLTAVRLYDELDSSDAATVNVEYTLSSGDFTSSGTWVLTVNGLNDDPVANDDFFVTWHSGVVSNSKRSHVSNRTIVLSTKDSATGMRGVIGI